MLKIVGLRKVFELFTRVLCAAVCRELLWYTVSFIVSFLGFYSATSRKVAELCHFYVFREVVYRQYIVFTLTGEDVGCYFRPRVVRGLTWYHRFYRLCRCVVMTYRAVLYFLFDLKTHTKPIQGFSCSLLRLDNTKVSFMDEFQHFLSH